MGAHGHGNEGGHPRPSKPRICLASLPGVLGDGHIIFIAITGILCPLPVEGGPSPHSLLSVFTQQALLFINEIGVKKYLNKSKTCSSSSFSTPPPCDFGRCCSLHTGLSPDHPTSLAPALTEFTPIISSLLHPYSYFFNPFYCKSFKEYFGHVKKWLISYKTDNEKPFTTVQVRSLLCFQTAEIVVFQVMLHRQLCFHKKKVNTLGQI